ncbi:MAG: ATP-binding cassette domain-containing protein [FCB group bacterium]|jgi:ABC-2 type transport system ATP-binding protein|nr:ATP-binding cassette domain-containing protein [FCB group bacterium]
MIKAENLTMHYGPVQALRDVSFEVRQGEVVGLLGPNGAGKSTTMKILTTYLHPTGGTAKIDNIDILEDPLGVRKVTGYLPEVLPLYMDMEVRSYLSFVGKARGLSGAKLRERTEVVVEECGLRPMFRKVIRELSKGYKQRTALAQALIHDPAVIILDEPTSGLDPHQIVEIRQLIRSLAAGRTVILSTHILHEVEAVADRIVIISQGRIVGDGTLAELRARANKYERTRVSLLGDRNEIQRQLSVVDGATRVEFVEERNGAATFILSAKTGSELWREIGKQARAKGWEIRELTEQPLSLEETFLSLTDSADAATAKGGAA